jgi:hypothetical protein
MTKFFLSVLALSFSILPLKSFAWGERGHNVICDVASKLVQEPNLAKFFANRGEALGHTCNIPDILWRNVPEGKPGDQAHFLDPENAGVTLDNVPVAIADYFSLRKTEENNQQKAEALGSNWWRAQQLYNLALLDGRIAQTSPAPSASDAQNGQYPYNQAVLGFLTKLGLMGHFVGDQAMPYHNTADYDGFGTGHGGIHGFYESQCVAFYEFSLINDVKIAADAARITRPAGSVSMTPMEIFRKVSQESMAEKNEVEVLDVVLEPSKITTDANGLQFKTYAKRSPLETACPPFRALIVKQMARSALALAELWDMAYLESNRPDLKPYRSYVYPLVPQYIPIDYF